jgi:hypothetical protein
MDTDERFDRLERAVAEVTDHVVALLGWGHSGTTPAPQRFPALLELMGDVRERVEAEREAAQAVRDEELRAASLRIAARTGS